MDATFTVVFDENSRSERDERGQGSRPFRDLGARLKFSSTMWNLLKLTDIQKKKLEIKKN